MVYVRFSINRATRFMRRRIDWVGLTRCTAVVAYTHGLHTALNDIKALTHPYRIKPQ